MENMDGVNFNKMLKKFYKDKTVLITGHTGFKGSWLSLWLNEMGAKVIGYGLDPYTNNDNFVLTGLGERIVDIRGDIRDDKKLNEVFKKYKPQIVFHLAAQPLVRISYEKPKETYEVNVMGTLNMMESIKSTDSVKVAVMITTDKCYENKEQIWPYRENDPMGGYDPYSSSKGCCELLISSYRNSYFNLKDYNKHGKSIASVRAGNVIGGGDWSKDRIVPDCISSLMKNEDINIRNPKAIRPWQYVLEPLYGYLLLANKMYIDGITYSNSWNFGPNFDSIVSVEKVVEMIIKDWGHGNWIDSSQIDKPHEATLLNLDCTKAKVYLNWNPKLNIEKAINATLDWYNNYKTTDMYNFCKNQIEAYENLL